MENTMTKKNTLPTNNIENFATPITYKDQDKIWKSFEALKDFKASVLGKTQNNVTQLINTQLTPYDRRKMCSDMLFNLVKNFYSQDNDPSMIFYNKKYKGNVQYHAEMKRSYEIAEGPYMELKAELDEDRTETREGVDNFGKPTLETDQQHPKLGDLVLAQTKYMKRSQAYNDADYTLKNNFTIMNTLMALYKVNSVAYNEENKHNILPTDYVHPLVTQEEQRIREYQGRTEADKYANKTKAEMDAIIAKGINNRFTQACSTAS